MARVAVAMSADGLLERLKWGVARAVRLLRRRLGPTGLTLALCALVVVSCWVLHRRAAQGLAELSAAASVERQPVIERVAVPEGDDNARLAAFQKYLLAAEDIPQVIQDLIALADDHRLLMSRGDYKAQQETSGGFLRYRMTLPVKGEAQAIQRFMAAALAANKTLALEAVSFKRETLASSAVEARIQWVLLTRLPARALVGGQS